MNDLRSRLNQRRELFVFRPYHHDPNVCHNILRSTSNEQSKVELFDPQVNENNVPIYISNVNYLVKSEEIKEYCEDNYGRLDERNGIIKYNHGLFFIKFKSKKAVDAFMKDKEKHNIGGRKWSCKRMYPKETHEKDKCRYQISNCLLITFLTFDEYQVVDISMMNEMLKSQGRIVSIKRNDQLLNFIVEFDDYDVVDKILIENEERCILCFKVKLEKYFEENDRATNNINNVKNEILKSELHRVRLGNHDLRSRVKKLEEELHYLSSKRSHEAGGDPGSKRVK
ncbi:unnamed protein product, partial [Didymodactylos carnosus]